MQSYPAAFLSVECDAVRVATGGTPPVCSVRGLRVRMHAGVCAILARPEHKRLPQSHAYVDIHTSSGIILSSEISPNMSQHREFFGPVGTFTCTIALPVIVYGLALASNRDQCMSIYPFSYPDWIPGTQLMSWTGIGVVYAWFFGHVFLHILMPARTRKGVVELDGNKWNYRLNGARLLLVFLTGAWAFVWLSTT